MRVANARVSDRVANTAFADNLSVKNMERAALLATRYC
jgi:hypothetical protein